MAGTSPAMTTLRVSAKGRWYDMAREPRMVGAMFTIDAMFMILRKALQN
jgi:hypothetical protein